MRPHSRRTLMSLMAGSFAASAFSRDAQANSGAEELEALFARKQIVIAMTEFDNAPFFSGDSDHLAGVDVELANRLGEALGLRVVFDRRSKSFNEVVMAVREGKADIAISKVSRTFARTRSVAFSKPYVTLRHAMIFNRLRLAQVARNRDIGDVARNFSGDLGVLANSSLAAFATQRFPKARIVPFGTWDEVVESALSGKIEAAYRDELEIRKIAIDRPDSTIHLRTLAISDAKDFIAAAVPWDSPRLLATMNQVIDDLPIVFTPDHLIERYRAQKKPAGEH